MAEHGKSQKTKDHDTIKTWIEQREGKPAVVEDTANGSGDSGLLRIDFPEYDQGSLKHISWKKFFEIFDNNDIQFLYQEQTSDGDTSQFCKFVSEN